MVRCQHAHPTPAVASTAAVRFERGFTLVELVVVMIVVGLLAAIAVPRYLALGRDARVAAVRALQAAVWTGAINVHTACKLDAACDYDNAGQNISIGGQVTNVNFGWPNAGDNLNGGQIDSWVIHGGGITASLPDIFHTRFSLDAAPDPVNCSVLYFEARTPGGPQVDAVTSGC